MVAASGRQCNSLQNFVLDNAFHLFDYSWNAMQSKPRYNVARMHEDMVAKGWQPVDLARKCRPPVSASSVTRFFSGAFQTPRMAKRLSRALGHAPDHYLIRSGVAA